MLQFGIDRTPPCDRVRLVWGYAQPGGEIASKTLDCNKESLAIDG
jgi:hypothetical protein